MPKKSKKAKIIAAYRRKVQFIENNEIKIEDVNGILNKHNKIINIQKDGNSGSKSPILPLNQEDLLITKFFFADLKKSLILICGILALEFFLYFVTINQ